MIANSKPAFAVILFVLLGVLFFSVLIAVVFGPVRIAFGDVYRIIFYKLFGIGSASNGEGPIHDIVWLIRFPRVILALAIGMALSVSGAVMQAIVKNPLADPYILGISSGASLGATFAIMLGFGAMFGSNSIGLFAFLGAVGISFLVQIIANIGGQANSIRLLLGGLALSAVCSAFSNFIVFFAHDREAIGTITFWLMGSLGGAKWHLVLFVLPFILICTLALISQSRILNIMLLGDDAAITLGIDLYAYRHSYLIISSLMIGLAVYSAGMIGFVGLIIPHLVRMLVGTDHNRLLPTCALVGAIFLIWADVACRIILKTGELPLGILISMIGAPIFIYLMLKKTYAFGGN